MGIAEDLIYILIAALLGGALAHIVRLPLLIGYILAGIIVGPYTGGFSVKNIHQIEMLAEIGVALLLFTLGLEFSFKKLKQLIYITLIGTPIQLIICWGIGYFISTELGISKTDTIWIGAAISLSSTMVVMKLLISSRQIDSDSGKLMISILIAQDVAIVPMMLILPQLSGSDISAYNIAVQLIKSSALIVVLYILGSKLLPKLFAMMSKRRSNELFFLTTLSIALGAGYLFHHMGLSFALGAFIAGMLLSDSDFNHQAMSSVSGLKDLFSLIFFASVGMLFDPGFFVDNISIIFTLVVTIIFSKALIITAIVRLFGFARDLSIVVGLGLAQIGEFAFVIITSGSKLGYLSKSSFSLIIATTVASMILTPGLFWLAKKISIPKRRRPRKDLLNTNYSNTDQHIIIIGAGVVGQYLAKSLQSLNLEYVIIESDYKIFLKLKDSGFNIIFGNAVGREILKAANIKKAKLVTITTTNDAVLPAIVSEIKSLAPNIPVIARVQEVEKLESLTHLELEEIVQPQMEVGLEMLRQSLLSLKMADLQIITILSQLRDENYNIINRKNDKLQSLAASNMLELAWIEAEFVLDKADELKIKDAQIRERFGVSIVAVMRADKIFSSPEPELELCRGDMIGVIGSRSQLQLLRKEQLNRV